MHRLIRWIVADENGFKGQLGLLLNSPLQEYLNKCFSVNKLQKKLSEFISVLVDGEVTDDERAAMTELFGKCMQENAPRVAEVMREFGPATAQAMREVVERVDLVAELAADGIASDGSPLPKGKEAKEAQLASDGEGTKRKAAGPVDDEGSHADQTLTPT